MTDNVEQVPAVTTPEGSAKAAPETASAKPEKATKKTSTEPSAKSKAGTIIAVVALLLVFLSLAAVGGIAWKGYELSQQVASLDQNLRDSEGSKVSLQQKLANIEKQALLQTKQIKNNGERLAQLPGADRNDWLLAEVEYLLRLANQRLVLENDVQGSLAILNAADKVLAETDSPLLFTVRQLVAGEIQTLKAVPAVDSTGAVARLQAVQNQIAQLEWMPRTLPEKDLVEEPVKPLEQSPWQKFLDKALAGISVVVRIREHEKALPAPLTPDQQYYLQQNMHLMLEQAQVALVRQNSDLYLQSISRTQAWLDQFVMVESANAIAVKETLTELKTWQVAPAMPDISGSLNKLRQLMKQQRRDSALLFQQNNPTSTQ